jgi:hypothetical protein
MKKVLAISLSFILVIGFNYPAWSAQGDGIADYTYSEDYNLYIPDELPLKIVEHLSIAQDLPQTFDLPSTILDQLADLKSTGKLEELKQEVAETLDLNGQPLGWPNHIKVVLDDVEKFYNQDKPITFFFQPQPAAAAAPKCPNIWCRFWFLSWDIAACSGLNSGCACGPSLGFFGIARCY